MFTNEQKIKAVELLIEKDMNFAAVTEELGYPAERTLYDWYKAYQRGKLNAPKAKKKRFSLEQRQAAVDHYIQNGKNYCNTIRELGYPSRQVLQKWVVELAPEEKKCVDFTEEQKREAVELLKNRGRKSGLSVAKELGVNRETLYKWKNEFERIESGETAKPRETMAPLREENAALRKQIEELQEELRAVQGELQRVREKR